MSNGGGSVHRTGPLPAASDYSKTLLHALVDENTGTILPMGSVSRMQLLLMSLVERVHDAIYVLPRHARDAALGTAPAGPGPSSAEYATDVANVLKQLKVICHALPDDNLTDELFQSRLSELNEKLSTVRGESSVERAKEVKGKIEELIKNGIETPETRNNTP
jgi:hypothetical protein